MKITSEAGRDAAHRYEKVMSDDHPWHLMATYVGDNGTVLDVGCGSGALAAVIGHRAARLDGIELDHQRAALAATRYHTVVVGAAGSADVSAPLDAYDVVICSDVVEHVADPAGLVQWAAAHVATEGKLIALIPNSANFAVRWKILRGDWSYEDTGHFDRDHLRFFDITTAVALGQACAGLREVARHYIPAELPTRRLRHRQGLAARLTRWRPNLFAAHVLLVWERPA